VNHRTKPDAPNVVQMIEAELAKKATVKPTETKPQAVTAPGAPSN
jgi:hypothetical protein